MSFAVVVRQAGKPHCCQGWGCHDRAIPPGALYARRVEFVEGRKPRPVILCEACAERYPWSAFVLGQRRAKL